MAPERVLSSMQDFINQVWCLTPVIPVLRRQRQENHKYKVKGNLEFMRNYFLKNK